MNKKAGIIIGVFIIGLTVAIYWIANGGKPKEQAPKEEKHPTTQTTHTKKKENSDANKSQTSTNSTQSENGQEDINGVKTVTKETTTTTTESASPNTQTTQDQQGVSAQTNQQTEKATLESASSTASHDNQASQIEGETTFTEITQKSIGTPEYAKTEIMVASKKKILLMDGAYGTDQDKQLVYVVDALSGNRVYHLYLNKVAYKQVTTGDKLKVRYAMYKNKAGVEFPVIVSVEMVKE